MENAETIALLSRLRADLMADVRACAMRRIQLFRRLEKIDKALEALNATSAIPKRRRREQMFRRGEFQRIVASVLRESPGATDKEIAVIAIEKAAGRAAIPQNIDNMLDRVRRTRKRLSAANSLSTRG